MRIGCLQFAPQVGDVDNNLNRADAVLSKANVQDLDLLVLPEMAFSGYNFRSLQHITPYLEPTTSGISSLWARTTALKHNCVVVVGYPEKVDVSPKWPASPEYYNSAIVVSAEGETIANYRKSFLYYTDETWALEGPDGFFDGEIDGLGNTAMGICKWPTKSFERDPYKFEAPWSAWEFAYHILHKEANLVILSMAWLTRENARSYSRTPKEPDMETLSYWLSRLEPIIRAETEGEIIVVMANRIGVEEEAVYAGTSTIIGIQGGEVKVYGILGRGEKELLVVDTKKRPQAKLISEQNLTPNTVKGNESEQESTVSKASAVSDVSKASIETALTVPDVGESPRSIADVMAQLSPADPGSPNAFFSTKDRRDDLIPPPPPEHRKSSIPERTFSPPVPASPTFVRPPSPKSRNASRTRPPLEPSQPVLISHDVSKEEQTPQRALGVKSSPHSAAAVPDDYHSSSTASTFGARSEYMTSRPKSAVW
ncbi:carbon-nitrogen hydrolase [Calycina marina]|uniref:Carbon-nitrogen hydrolase n=1 Tax=Calycina marina TaxID=1763456 RepID=A0A9P7Z605_9HELO|nr:carbon-nitrogen hydrolase [Calycina marina]